MSFEVAIFTLFAPITIWAAYELYLQSPWRVEK